MFSPLTGKAQGQPKRRLPAGLLRIRVRPLVCAGLLGFSLVIAQAADLPPLTLKEAQETALKNHPQISVAELRALAARQVTRQAQAGFFPFLSANAVGVGTANRNTRLAAIGALNNPSIFDRNAEGLLLSQLITDFGRTANLASSAKLRAQAEENNTQATRAQILLEVDGAYYAALQAQAVARVADKTVATRKLFLEQVTELTKFKQRSDLDVSFAKVNLEEAKLLLAKAQNDLQAADAQLVNLMGAREPKTYQLVEEAMPLAVATNIEDYIQQGLRSRPELLRARNERDAALKFARAEKALSYPTLSAVGSAGVTPVHDPALSGNYAAAGVVLSVPLFAGGLYTARQKEALLRAQAAEASLRDAENNVIRDVRIAWLNTQNAFERLQITDQLSQHAALSFELAQARFNALSISIVELNQADLNLISAQINYTNTKYEYLLQRAALDFQVGALH